MLIAAQNHTIFISRIHCVSHNISDIFKHKKKVFRFFEDIFIRRCIA